MKKKMKIKIKKNIWGNWSGYEGTKKVKEFGTSEWDAKIWLTEMTNKSKEIPQ